MSAAKTKEDGRKIGIEIAREIRDRISDRVAGFHLHLRVVTHADTGQGRPRLPLASRRQHRDFPGRQILEVGNFCEQSWRHPQMA